MESLSVKKSKRMEVDFGNLRPKCPKEVFIDLNSTCNCRCSFCGNGKIKYARLLDKKLGFRVIEEFYDLGTREMALYATGEPLLRKDLSDFVDKAKKTGYEYVFMSSNGILATPDRAKGILNAGLDSIKFSINAGARDTYHKIHGVDALDQVINNVKWFYSYRKTSGLKYRIYASMVLSSVTKDERPLLEERLAGYVDELDFRSCSNQGGNMLENNLTERIDPRNILGSLKKDQCTGRCPDLFARSVVTPEGYMSACCVDYQNFLIVADLNYASVAESWNNEVYVGLRQRHNAGDLEGLICHNCLNNVNNPVKPLREEYARMFENTKR